MPTSKWMRFKSSRNMSRSSRMPAIRPPPMAMRALNSVSQQHDLGDVALLHAENVVKPQLLFAPLDEEAVGIVAER